MAQVKFSALVQSASGKLGGGFVSNSRSGFSLRNNPVKRHVFNRFSSLSRIYYGQVQAAWRNLSIAHRNAWLNTMYAGMQGYRLFVYANINMLYVSLPVLSLPFLSGVPIPQRITSFFVVPSTNTVFINMGSALPLYHRALCYISPPLSPGVEYDNAFMSFIYAITSPSLSQFNVGALYIAKFGAVPRPGQKVFLRVSTVNILSGFESAYSYAFSIVS